MKQTAKIFLCYAHEDEAKARELYQKLFTAGFHPWMDKIDLVGGEEWQSVIQKIIHESDFFIACISHHWGEGRMRFFRREIKTALDVLPELQTGDIYIIPVRLEDCDVPESLSLFHWVDYFKEDDFDHLVKSLHKGMDHLGLIKPIRLREQPVRLSQDDVARMLLEWDFYEIDMNRLGKGLKHQYEVTERYGEKTVIDHTTGLMWQQSGSENAMIFRRIPKNYLNKLNAERYSGYRDWRLPTLEEAASLLERKRNEHRLHIDPVFDKQQITIWTADKSTSGGAWFFKLGLGRCRFVARGSFHNFVRAVRHAQ